jgi:hypothetical protein
MLTSPRRVTRQVLHALVPIITVGAWALAIRDVRIQGLTDLGLISVMPAISLALLALLTISFAASLHRRPLHPWIPLLHMAVLLLMLYGVTALVEPQPRFQSVYRHAGIIDYIMTNRSVDPGVDAYFSWPGFFTLGAIVTKVAGFHSALSYAAWGTLAFNVLALPPLLAIFSWASDDPRVPWLGVWVFYSSNWVGQDYVSPQAVGFLLWLSMLAAVLIWFVPRASALAPAPSLRALPRHFGPRSLRAATVNGPDMAAGQRIGVLLLTLVIYGATVAGHQLTPVPALLGVSALAIVAALEVRVLPVIMGVILVAWLSYMTTTWLSGHFGTLTQSLGSVSKNVNQGVGARVAGSAEHQFVVKVRVVMSVAIWGLGIAGFMRLALQRRTDVAMAVLGATPILLPVLQPYGGEMFLRVFLFALPAAAFFIARLAFPSSGSGTTWPTFAAVACLGCVLLGGFQFTRYGNERVDAFTDGDVATVRALYRLAPPGSLIVGGTGNIPWRYIGYADRDYTTVEELPAWASPRPDPAFLLRDLRQRVAPRGGYLIVTRSAMLWADVFDGKPRALPRLVGLLRRSSSARLLYSGRDGDIFFVRPAAAR